MIYEVFFIIFYVRNTFSLDMLQENVYFVLFLWICYVESATVYFSPTKKNIDLKVFG